MPAKKISLALIVLPGMSLSWMVFETSSTFISARTSSLKTKLKEKLALFLRSIYSGTPGWFLYSTFMVGSSMFCTKESQFPKLGILRCLTVFAKKLFSSLATFSQFVNKELFSSSVRFILPRKRVFWRKRV